jgi:hypothetical protein
VKSKSAAVVVDCAPPDTSSDLNDLVIPNPEIRVEGRRAMFSGKGFYISRSLIFKEKNKDKIFEVFVFIYIILLPFFFFLYIKITISDNKWISLPYVLYHFFSKLDCSFWNCGFFQGIAIFK